MSRSHKAKSSLPTSQENLLMICGNAFGFALHQAIGKFNNSDDFPKKMVELGGELKFFSKKGLFPEGEDCVIQGIIAGYTIADGLRADGAAPN